MVRAESLNILFTDGNVLEIESIIQKLSEKQKQQLFQEQFATTKTLLHLAVILDNRELVSKLLDLGAEINIKNIMGNTPLHIVNSIPVAEVLISNGANVNAKNDGNISVLHQLLRSGKLKLFEFVLNNENVDTTDLKEIYHAPMNCTKQELRDYLYKVCREYLEENFMC